MIYFILCSKGLSAQSKRLQGDAGLWARVSGLKSVSSGTLRGMIGDFVCLSVSWSMGALACRLTVRVSAPLSAEEYQRRRWNPYNPTGWVPFLCSDAWVHAGHHTCSKMLPDETSLHLCEGEKHVWLSGLLSPPKSQNLRVNQGGFKQREGRMRKEGKIQGEKRDFCVFFSPITSGLLKMLQKILKTKIKEALWIYKHCKISQIKSFFGNMQKTQIKHPLQVEPFFAPQTSGRARTF